MSIRVRATATGYYGIIREVGDEFEIGSEKDLGSWMLRLDGGNNPQADKVVEYNEDIVNQAIQTPREETTFSQAQRSTSQDAKEYLGIKDNSGNQPSQAAEGEPSQVLEGEAGQDDVITEEVEPAPEGDGDDTDGGDDAGADSEVI